MPEERRRVARVPLTAAAELFEEKSGTRAPAYLTNLSLQGCTLCVIRPLPKGMVIQVEIVTGAESFQSRGTIAHSCTSSAGLAFQDLDSQSLIVLRRLLVTATAQQPRRDQS